MPEQQTSLQPKPIPDDEIDLISLAKNLWNGRKIIIISLISGAIIGLIVALSSAKEYTVSTVMVPQLGGDSQSKLGGFSGLAALAGINIDLNQSAELSPVVYPQIVNSIPFQLELMNTPLNFQDYQKPITLLDYYTIISKPTVVGTIKKYTVGLPGVLIGTIKGKPKELVLPGDSVNRPILLTKDQFVVKKILNNVVSLEINSKEGYITLITTMSEAIAATQLAQKAQSLLQLYITEFRIKKVKADLHFIQERYNETKSEFEKAQVSLAIVKDKNKNFTSSLPQIEADRIQTRYAIAFSVFQELAKQLEQAKIQVKKETPAFAVIQPVSVPYEQSKPNRPMILIVWIFLGGIVGIGTVFGRGYLSAFKKQWNAI